MAKKYKRKSSKCPEPFNTLLDIAGGIAMGTVASRMEKKYNYTKKGKINPYAVSALGISSGKMKSTEDLLMTGAILGAMGSFDVDADDTNTSYVNAPEDPVFRQIRETKVNDNRYAWRLNCEDGSVYGLSPYDYETRPEYNEALRNSKSGSIKSSDILPVAPTVEASIDNEQQYIYCRVSRLDNGANDYYLSSSENVKVGDSVKVPTETGSAMGIIIAIEKHSTATAPQPPENTPWLLAM